MFRADAFKATRGSNMAFGCMNESTWHEIVAALKSEDVNACVAAASRVQKESGPDDVPKLLALLNDESFFVREAAAWPLAELAGPSALREMLVAYQHGFDERHDNDGFTAALIEVASLNPETTKTVLNSIIQTAAEPMKGHAQWLLEFC